MRAKAEAAYGPVSPHKISNASQALASKSPTLVCPPHVLVIVLHLSWRHTAVHLVATSYGMYSVRVAHGVWTSHTVGSHYGRRILISQLSRHHRMSDNAA